MEKVKLREKAKRTESFETTERQEKILGELGIDDGVRVSKVLLHQPFTVVGMTASTLYDHKGFNMLFTSKGLICEYYDNLEKEYVNFIVAHANIIVAYV